jgi:hypothetical protein
MTQCIQEAQFLRRRNRRQDKRERMLKKMSNWRAAKLRKRQERIAAGWRPEPKLVRAYPIELGVRYIGGREECWVPLKSVRDAARRLRLILKFCQ